MRMVARRKLLVPPTPCEQTLRRHRVTLVTRNWRISVRWPQHAIEHGMRVHASIAADAAAKIAIQHKTLRQPWPSTLSRMSPTKPNMTILTTSGRCAEDGTADARRKSAADTSRR